MRYAILGLGSLGALIFLYSVYAFWVHPEQFKTIAYIFMFITAIFFILVVIKKIREEKALNRKLDAAKNDPVLQKK